MIAPGPTPLVPAPATPAARVEAWADVRVSPVVLLELRRSTRNSKLLLGFVVVLAAGAFSTFLLADHEWRSAETARIVLLAVLAGAASGLVPFAASQGLVSERREEAWAPTLLTHLRPSTLVWGRIQAAALQLLLVGAAIGPFLLVFTTVEAVSFAAVALAVLLLLAVHPLAMGLALVSATLDTHGGAENLRVLLTAQALIGLAVMSGTVANGIIERPDRFLQTEPLLALGGLAVSSFLLGPALARLAGERLAPPRESSTRLPRLLLLANDALLLALLWTIPALGRDELAILVLVWCGFWHTLFALLSFGQAGRAGGALAFLLPGERNGRRYLLLALGPLAFGCAMVACSGWPSSESDWVRTAGALLVVVQLAGVLSVPLVLRPLLPPGFWTPGAQAIGAVALGATLVVLGVLERQGPLSGALAGLSPVVPLFAIDSPSRSAVRDSSFALGFVFWGVLALAGGRFALRGVPAGPKEVS